MRKLIPLVAGCAALAGASASTASAPPVGPLPPSPVTTISTVSEELFAFALPRGQSGLVWRGKSNTNPRVARPVTEVDAPGNVTVLVYVAGRPGVADVTYGLTNGEHVRAYRGARFHIVVKPRPR